MLGFDTEYTRKRKLICYQLSNGLHSAIYTDSMTLESFAEKVSALTGVTNGSVWIVTFWSYAELQFFPILKRSHNWRLYASGSFDCTFNVGTLTLNFFDLARFFERSPLWKVAESFGEEKLEYDVTNVTAKSLKDPKFIAYAKHDAYLCWTILDKLRKEFIPLGADPLISKTAAGLSSTVFRFNYLPDKLPPPTPRGRLAGMYACWGGRAEVFRRGRHAEVWEYDLDSAYPNAAISIGKFPVGEDLKCVSKLRHTGFAKVFFKFPDVDYPCLPCIIGDSQVYPLTGVSWATSFEIEQARTLGCKLDIIEAWEYKGGSSALSDMMQWALEIRRKSTGAKNIAAKLIANAMIGKLAQRRTSISIDDIRDLCERVGVSIHDVILLNGKEMEALGLKRESHIGTSFMPEWNALITGYVRAQLHRLILASTPVYCATDSVWSTTEVADKTGLSVKRHGAAITVRTRLAALFDTKKTHVAHHSIWRRDAALELIEKFDTVERLPYTVSRPIKLRESLRKKIRIGTFVEELRQGKSTWDQKRELLPSGMTRPWSTVDEYLRARKTKWDVSAQK